MWNSIVNVLNSVTTFVGLWLVKAWNDPTVQKVLQQTVKDLVGVGEEVLRLAVDAVREAAMRKDLDTKAKFDFVVSEVMNAFPGIGMALARKIVENAYGSVFPEKQ